MTALACKLFGLWCLAGCFCGDFQTPAEKAIACGHLTPKQACCRPDGSLMCYNGKYDDYQ